MLILEDISTFYGKIQVLKKISLNVQDGEIVALIGANGAGKTTTLRTISGLVRPASGKVEFMGRRIEKMTANDIPALGIAHVPEGGGIFRKMTVQENLELGAGNQKDKATVAKTLREVLGRFPILGQRKGQLAGTLSGGERQMLALGRAMMSRPAIYILDEPSLGLSPFMVKSVAGMISQLREEGATVLLVEQNATMALGVADRGYVLEVGSIVLQEKASVLLSDDHVRRAYLGL